MKTVYAKISGRGEFPLDMLRRDSCSPATEEDSRLIARTFGGRSDSWEIHVKCRPLDKNSPWTVGRWESFRCKIQPLGERRPALGQDF